MAERLSDEEDWNACVSAALSGDKREYTRLLSNISSYVRGRIAKTLANPEAADDISQDVLVSVHKSLHTYTPDRPFKPWLNAIINFRKTDYLRKYYASKKNQTVSDDVLDFDLSYVTESPNLGELKDIETALRSLPDKQRDIFTKIKIEGYSIEEVANEMGMNESAVKVSAHRTAKKLQGMLK